MPYVKLSDKNLPRPDRMKAVLLERMHSEGKNQMEVASAMNVSLRTFQRLMKQHTETWSIEQLTLGLRSVGIRLTLRTNYDDGTN